MMPEHQHTDLHINASHAEASMDSGVLEACLHTIVVVIGSQPFVWCKCVVLAG